MKLSQLLAGATALAFAAGAASSALAASNTQTFNVSGSVTATCLIYFSNTTGAIGNIPVNVVASSASSTYFHMTDTGGDSQTLLGQGGCNDDNTVEITKGNGATGMTSTNTSSFDPAVFQNTLPYNVELGWTGTYGGNQHGPSTPENEGLPLPPNSGDTGAFANGAFASSMNITFLVEDQPKALLSGTYTDTVMVTLTAS
jgi:hypothetical protein